MRKRVIAALLAALFALTVPACAAGGAGGFSDVPEGAWCAPAVTAVREAGLMRGVAADRFDPDGTFTRAQLAAVLHRMAGEPETAGVDSFTDTAPGAWYAAAVLWAEQSGVVNGVGGGRFAPNDPVTQEQLAVMLWRMAGEPAAANDGDASAYAASAVGWVKARGIAPQTEGYTFTPRQNAARAQVAALLHGYLTRDTEEEVKPVLRQEIVLTVAGRTLAVDWAENSTVDALRELLRGGSITLDMSDYGGFEKGAPLPETLPQNNEPMDTTAGDIILYQGRQFVIYYGTNSWSLTPLGRVTDPAGDALRELLGAGNVTATLSLTDA